MKHGKTVFAFLAERNDNFLLLRILAALAVIYGHSFAIAPASGAVEFFIRHGWPMYSGDMAVAIFFVVSGFMVSGSYMARHDFVEFAKARLLRIVPGFALVVIVCAYVIGPGMSSLALVDYMRDPAVPAYAIKNLRFSSDMAWQLPGVFSSNPSQTVNGSLWTLPAEMRMYVLTAAMGALGLLAGRTVGTLVLLACLYLGMKSPEYFPLHQDWIRLAAFFALGVLIQLNKERIGVSHAAMFMLVFVTYISMRTQAASLLFGLTLAYFCFWFAYCTPTWRSLARGGDPSYGIYLWGWPVQQVLVACFPTISPLHNFLVGAVLATALGYASWWGLERRVLALKDWRPRGAAYWSLRRS